MRLIVFSLLLFVSGSLLANNNQEEQRVYTGAEASEIISIAETIREGKNTEIPSYVKFKKGNEIAEREFIPWVKKAFKLDPQISFTLIKEETDKIGHSHWRFQQTYAGHNIEGAVLVGHAFNGKMYSMNGVLYRNIGWNTTSKLTEEEALAATLAEMDAETFKWELEVEEDFIKRKEGENATFYPRGQLVYAPVDGEFSKDKFRLAWRFNIYVHKPVKRAWMYTDAVTGKVIFENNIICTADVNGTAQTAYSGAQTITADSYTGGFRLRESGRGNGIETYDMNQGTNYGSAVDFTDADNNWNNVNPQLDEYATDAHWGAEMTYDYYWTQQSRNSIDGAGFKLESYIHYDVSYVNAFWDGSRMTYGDGNGATTPLTSIDIAGHEVTHGLTNFTSNLVYSNESGALNESFSDIFGATIEFYGVGLANGDWLMGEDIGSAFRNMANPNAAGDPDTYLGTNWYTGTADNGGVHTNSGVQNFWFYLLSEGGTGTNDIGDAYNVDSIGLWDAASIAFRNNTVYLTSSSQYADARFYAIQSAVDLFGGCSPQVIATANAWHAVGVGPQFDTAVTANFVANQTDYCAAPAIVEFTNNSSLAGSYSWDFGDGTTDTAANPTHTYMATGTYTVTLIADGGTCGIDTLVRNAYINIDNSNPCVATVTSSTQTSCTGLLYDDGGTGGNYSDNNTYDITIAPTGASQVTLDFTFFDVEAGSGATCDYDYIEIFDGPTTGSTSLGRFCNTTGSPGTIVSSGGALTVRQYSDLALNEAGFEANWTCVIPNSPPMADFTVSIDDCAGDAAFQDVSLQLPTSWFWDFGDGATSTLQNPTHNYALNGLYTVTLIATNSFGSDTVIRTDIVSINKATGPNGTDGSRCGMGMVTLNAASANSGRIDWYGSATSTTVLDTGASYTTPVLAANTLYYAEEVTGGVSAFGGPMDNTFGTGGFFTGDRDLVFNCTSPVTLVSALVYANGAANRTIELKNSAGVVLLDTVIFIPNGSSRVNIGFDIPIGTGLTLGCTAGADLFRNNASASYPYSVGSAITITGSTASSTGFYYYFYDWEISEPECISERVAIEAKINNFPSVTATGGTNTCSGTPVTLSASGADINSYSWSSGSTNATSTVSPTVTTVYTVSATNSCGTTTDTTLVTIDPAPAAVASNDTSVCAGNAVPLSVAANGSINWSTGSTASTTTVNPTSTTTYNVTSTNGCGTATDAVTVTITPLPTVSASNDTASCSGTFVTLSASSSTGSYAWSTSSSSSSINVSPSSTTTYSVSTTNSCGTSSDNVTVTIDASPSATASNDTTVCIGDVVPLSSTGVGSSYSWSSGATTQNTSVSPTSSTTYTVTYGNACGTTSDNVMITVMPLPTLVASNDTTICNGSSAVLTANSSSSSYNWSTGQTASSIIVNPSSNTSFIVSSTNSCGTTSESVMVTVISAPTVTASGDVTTCAGQNITLSASSSNGVYNWSTGDNTASIIVSPLFSSIYTVTSANSCGSASDNISVTVSPLPTASFIQSGSAATRNFSNSSANAVSYLWNFGDGSSSSIASPSHTFTMTGNYNVMLVAQNACGNDTTYQTVSVQVPTDVQSPTSVWNANVYPNPNAGVFTLNVAGLANEELSVRLYDMQGKLIEDYQFGESEELTHTFDFSHLADAVYMLRLSTANEEKKEFIKLMISK